MALDSVRGKKVFVGLSGGVDSAVSAALLKRSGADVTGVFIKGWYPSGFRCTWAEERRDAMRVAARLEIPFRTFDASAEYKQSVIGYLLNEYRKGRTPNPDVMCNREIKFGVFYQYAMSNGADAIATGHYRSGEKDQSYFLWAVQAERLAKTIFPVGQMTKEQVRKLARRFNLPVAGKKDSRGICFLGNVSVDEFLRREFGEKRGPAVDENGNKIGIHDGALLYTIGERVPLILKYPNSSSDIFAGPWFVAAKDMEKNELVVTRNCAHAASKQCAEIRFTLANWIGKPSEAVQAQFRYRGVRFAGSVVSDGSIPFWKNAEPLRETPASGQSIVFYDANGLLIGGGIVE